MVDDAIRVVEKINVVLYEKINENVVFNGVFRAEKKNYPRLGYFIDNKRKKFYMECPSSDYFFMGKKIKTLAVCKYGDEDYRPIKFLKGNGYYRRAEQIVFEEEIYQNEETGEEVIKKVPKIDKKTGKYVTEVKKVYYDEPMAVQQSDKEVMRFARDFRKKMDEKRKATQSWWQQNLPLIINVSVIIMFFLFVMLYAKTVQDEKIAVIQAFDDNAKELLAQIEDPSYVDRLVEKFDRKEAEANAPIN